MLFLGDKDVAVPGGGGPLLWLGDRIDYLNSIFYVAEAEGQPHFSQVVITQSPEKPVPRRPAHLIIQSWPIFAVLAYTEENEITSYRVNNFHDGNSRGLANAGVKYTGIAFRMANLLVVAGAKILTVVILPSVQLLDFTAIFSTLEMDRSYFNKPSNLLVPISSGGIV